MHLETAPKPQFLQTPPRTTLPLASGAEAVMLQATLGGGYVQGTEHAGSNCRTQLSHARLKQPPRSGGMTWPLLCLLGSLSAGLAGCSGSEEGSAASQPLTAAPPPASRVDAFGRTWIRVSSQPVVYDDTPESGDEGAGADKPTKDLDIRNMSAEDVTAALRPISLFGDYEYTLSEPDAREFALAIQAVARAEKGTEGGLGAHAIGQPALEGPDEREPGSELPVDLPQPKAIIGADDRYSINFARNSFPWNNYGRMDNAGTCSAVKLVNHHTAVTSAHCVHTGSAWKARKRITFGSLPTVGSTCYGMTVPGCWNGSTENASCDYATIMFREGWGYCDFATYNVGYLGWQSVGNSVSGIWGHVSGYPSEQMKPSWSYPELVYHERGDGYTTFTYPDRVFYTVDTTGGQSGGPFTSYFANGDYRVRGVHKGYHPGVFSESNQARKMTQSLFNWFVANGGS